MNPDDGYYGYTEGELRVTTGDTGYVGVQLEQTTTERPVTNWKAWDRTKPVAESVVKHVVRMYRDARTMKQIGAQTGYSPANIYRILKKAGEPTRPQGTKGTGRCVDCDAKCGMDRRCKMHRKVRHAELNLEAVYRYRMPSEPEHDAPEPKIPKTPTTKEGMREYMRRWRAQNREHVQEYQAARKLI